MKRLSIADWLSIYRIIMSPAIVVFIFLSENKQTAGWLLLISFLTDAVDGVIARRFNMRSDRGANLDSVGDALTFAAAVFGLFWFEFDFIRDHLISISIALGLYLLQVFIAIIKYGRTTSFHTYSAKTAAIFQAVFLVTFYIHGIVSWLYWAGIAISILETIEEIILIFMLRKWKADVKGIYWVMKDRKKGV